MSRTTIALKPPLAEAVDRVRKQRRDEKRSVTVRLLLREALAARGIRIEEDPGGQS